MWSRALVCNRLIYPKQRHQQPKSDSRFFQNSFARTVAGFPGPLHPIYLQCTHCNQCCELKTLPLGLLDRYLREEYSLQLWSCQRYRALCVSSNRGIGAGTPVLTITELAFRGLLTAAFSIWLAGPWVVRYESNTIFGDPTPRLYATSLLATRRRHFW